MNNQQAHTTAMALTAHMEDGTARHRAYCEEFERLAPDWQKALKNEEVNSKFD